MKEGHEKKKLIFLITESKFENDRLCCTKCIQKYLNEIKNLKYSTIERFYKQIDSKLAKYQKIIA